MSPDPAVVTPPARRFEGKTAIVTGAGSGIGRATAIRLAVEGASVACLDVVADNLDETVEALATLGAKAVAYRCDVTDESQVNDTVTEVASALGRPDVLCNVAGIGTFAHTAELPLATWERILAVNLTGTFLMTRAALAYMLEPPGGSIVNIASTSGLMGSAYSAAYCGVEGWRDHVHQGSGHRVRGPGGAHQRGGARGGRHPAARELPASRGRRPKHIYRITSRMGFCTPDQVAAAIAFLASDESAYTTGAVLAVDGGITA